MKHNKEWYTCDRCGKEMFIFDYSEHRFLQPKTLVVDTETFKSDAYLSDVVKAMPEINSCLVNVIRYYKSNDKRLHLCEKCRKDFEKFMGCKL